MSLWPFLTRPLKGDTLRNADIQESANTFTHLYHKGCLTCERAQVHAYIRAFSSRRMWAGLLPASVRIVKANEWSKKRGNKKRGASKRETTVIILNRDFRHSACYVATTEHNNDSACVTEGLLSTRWGAYLSDCRFHVISCNCFSPISSNKTNQQEITLCILDQLYNIGLRLK